jgi:hypothetical protein
MSGKGREAFPPIADELHAAPRAKMNVALPPRGVPAEMIDDTARTVGSKWGSSTQLLEPLAIPVAIAPQAEAPKAPREPWINKRFECPPYLDRELAVRSATEGASISYLILKALAGGGFTVHEEDLNKDRRKYRK